jgi:hypothetical protein
MNEVYSNEFRVSLLRTAPSKKKKASYVQRLKLVPIRSERKTDALRPDTDRQRALLIDRGRERALSPKISLSLFLSHTHTHQPLTLGLT